jgi:hypothetical protein
MTRPQPNQYEDSELREAILGAFSGIDSEDQYIDTKARFVIDDILKWVKARDEQQAKEIASKYRLDNIYAIGGITHYQIILFKGNKEVMRTPLYDIHTQLEAQGSSE